MKEGLPFGMRRIPGTLVASHPHQLSPHALLPSFFTVTMSTPHPTCCTRTHRGNICGPDPGKHPQNAHKCSAHSRMNCCWPVSVSLGCPISTKTISDVCFFQSWQVCKHWDVKGQISLARPEFLWQWIDSESSYQRAPTWTFPISGHTQVWQNTFSATEYRAQLKLGPRESSGLYHLTTT